MNERVKKLRKSLNLSGEKFGDKLGVTKHAVSQIETGKNNLTEQMIKAICREFSVNEDWLRNGSGEMFVITKNDYIETLSRSYNLDQIDKAILETYLSLSTDKRSVIKEYILNVAQKYNDGEEARKMAEIDREVEAYRKELEAELKGAEKSSALENTGINAKSKKNKLRG